MPKRIVSEETHALILQLRAEGLTYQDISNRTGVSAFLAWKHVNDFATPSVRAAEKEAYQLRQQGLSIKAIAEIQCISPRGAGHRIERYKKFLSLSPN